MARRKKSMGVGATVSALSRMLHPSANIREHYPNPDRVHKLSDLLVIGREMRKINGKQTMAILMRHDTFPNITLYCAERFAVIEQEGPTDGFFSNPLVAETNDEEPAAGDEEMLPDEVQELLHQGYVGPDDARLVSTAVPTDDDMQPAPENIPEPAEAATEVMGEWGHNNICARKASGARNVGAQIALPREFPTTILRIFELFFMKDHVINTIIPLINQRISPGEPASYGEFLRWIGLWLLMATIQGPPRREFWRRDEEISRFHGAPFRLGDLMSRTRFEAILLALKYTATEAPTYKDPFFEVRDMLAAWNANMEKSFTPSWVSCLDESMSFWTNQYSCPGFMFVPRKPWPFGNEYHSICCGLSGVMYAIELVEGKSAPRERGRPEFEELGGATVGLLLRLTKMLWSTGKVVVLDSGFCVVKALLELRKKGVFAAALIKKRRYWPKFVNGDYLKGVFANKEVGEADAFRINLEQDEKIDIHCFREPDYTMMLMSTYGTLERVGGDKKRTWIDGAGETKSTTFKYPELVYNHFQYRHAVDDHNNRRQSPISIERTWGTNWWPNRVFAFLISITEINTMKAWVNIFGNPEMETLEFRKQLAHDLINNPYLLEAEAAKAGSRKRRASTGTGHVLMKIPKNSTFRGAQLVQTACPYAQRKCSACINRVRTYCSCSPGIILCSDCFGRHCIEVEMLNEDGI